MNKIEERMESKVYQEEEKEREDKSLEYRQTLCVLEMNPITPCIYYEKTNHWKTYDQIIRVGWVVVNQLNWLS
jgi:hypothetical protein